MELKEETSKPKTDSRMLFVTWCVWTKFERNPSRESAIGRVKVRTKRLSFANFTRPTNSPHLTSLWQTNIVTSLPCLALCFSLSLSVSLSLFLSLFLSAAVSVCLFLSLSLTKRTWRQVLPRLIWFDLIWCNYLSRFSEKQKYACQATSLLKITEHDKKMDIKERKRIGQEKGRDAKKLWKSNKSTTIM